MTKRIHDPDGPGAIAPRLDDYFWDGDEPVGVYGYNSLVFARGPLPDMVLFESATTLHTLLGDHQNTVRDVIATNGTADNHLIYTSYGNLKSQTGGGAYSPFHRFTGKPFDTAVGLQYNVNRWYDPATGRWISEDPIGFAGGDANLMRYVGSSPMNRIDPFGLLPPGEAAQREWKARRQLQLLQIQAALDWQGIVQNGGQRNPWGQGALGVGQGVLNTANGVQDIAVSTLNTPADIWNSTAGALGAPEAPTLDSPDWSKDALVEEADWAHDLSKFAGGVGVTAATGAGILIARTGPTMSVVIVRGTSPIKPIHAGWQLYGPWMHAQGRFSAMFPRIMGTGGRGFWTGGPGYWNTITGIPIRSVTGATGVEGPFWNCVTAVGSVFISGWRG